MSMKQCIRIEGDGSPWGTKVTDADSGNEIHGISKLTLTIDPQAYREGVVIATLEIMAEIDFTVEGEVKRMRLNDETGNYEEIED